MVSEAGLNALEPGSQHAFEAGSALGGAQGVVAGGAIELLAVAGGVGDVESEGGWRWGWGRAGGWQSAWLGEWRVRKGGHLCCDS